MDKIKIEHRLPFLIIRPSGLPFEEEILEDLTQAKLTVVAELTIYDWKTFARKLYYDKFGDREAGVGLQPGAEAWLDGTVVLFGNRAKVLLFGQEMRIPSPSEDLVLLNKLLCFKLAFRAKKKQEKERVVVTCSREGIRYPVFFDYIHATDPDIGRLRQEWSWLIQESSPVSHVWAPL